VDLVILAGKLMAALGLPDGGKFV